MRHMLAVLLCAISSAAFGQAQPGPGATPYPRQIPGMGYDVKTAVDPFTGRTLDCKDIWRNYDVWTQRHSGEKEEQDRKDKWEQVFAVCGSR